MSISIIFYDKRYAPKELTSKIMDLISTVCPPFLCTVLQAPRGGTQWSPPIETLFLYNVWQGQGSLVLLLSAARVSINEGI